MAFTMLKGQTVYVKRETIGDPYWDNGLMVAGETVTTYEELTDCFVEPLEREESEYLPTGIRTRDSRWLLCDHVLNTARENNDNASMADVIYLGDPTKGKKKTPFIVWEAEDWATDEGMELIENDGYNYVLIKEGKV